MDIANEVELIVSSPMRRTLQTTQQSLSWLIEEMGIPVVARAEWQENSDKPCDTGSDIETISKEFPNVDWSTIDPEYPSKQGLYEFSKEGLTRRGIAARKWLKERPESVIAVVSHAGFLRVGVSYRQYDNADFRIFNFAEGGEFDEVGGKLVEWAMTEERGGGLGKSIKGTFGFETQTFPNAKPDDQGTGQHVPKEDDPKPEGEASKEDAKFA